MFAFRGALVCGKHNVDVATTWIEAVCCFGTRVGDVDYFALEAGGATVGPAISVVTGL